MHDVGAAWLMTSLSPSPLLVALMQVVSSVPFFLLALPAGAIADVVDRRRLLLGLQSWMLVVAALLGCLTLAGITTPAILLALTFAMSLGSAMNMPVWQAITPELVGKEQLPAAVTLSGITINLSRSIGPALAGGIIAVAGTGSVFLLNAASFSGVLWVLYHWRRTLPKSALPAERVLGAVQAGIRYVRFAPPLQAVLIRSGTYIFFASALFALLPILGRRELGLDALGYGVMLGFWGLGGLAGAFLLPKVRRRISSDRLVAVATVVYGLMMIVLSHLRDFYGVCEVMIFVGLSSLAVMVSLNVAAQNAVPAWVRARALAVHLLVFQGAMAAGSLVWGTLAQRSGLPTAMMAAGIGAIVSLPFLRRYCLQCGESLDLNASLHWQQPQICYEPRPDDGPVMVTLEYKVDPANADEFVAAMQILGTIRRRDGAMQWGLFHDLSQCGRFVESFIVESWAEHKRQFERVTNADKSVEELARAFHIGDTPPKVSQMLYAYESGVV